MWSPSHAIAQRATKRRPTYISGIDVWSFAGLVLVLLIVLMVTTGPYISPGKSVDLPTSSFAVAQPRANRQDVMKVFISRDGDVFIGNRRVAPEELPGFIHDSLRKGAENKMYLAIDKRSKYRDTAKVIEQVQLAGIKNVCVLAESPARR